MDCRGGLTLLGALGLSAKSGGRSRRGGGGVGGGSQGQQGGEGDQVELHFECGMWKSEWIEKR